MLQVLAELIKIMRNQSPLFNKASTRFVYTGSYYKKTKVGLPDEFDLNLIIRLPIKEKDILVISLSIKIVPSFS